ncbi:hypothetical protein [Amycolatopsis ultiminotia]
MAGWGSALGLSTPARPIVLGAVSVLTVVVLAGAAVGGVRGGGRRPG